NAALSPAGARYNNILPKKDGEADFKDSKNQAIQPKSTTMPPPSPNVTYTQHPSMYHAGHPYVQISPQLPPNMVPMTPPSSVYMQADLSPSLGPSMDLDRNRRISTTSSTGSTADQREQARKESHSAIERRRRERINDKILQLKQLIPSCADQDHLHKMSILQSAIDYIAYLKDIIEKQGGKDLLHGKLAIKTVRSMLPKEVEAFTGQFSVKGRASVGSVDSFSSSPAWSSKQPLEYVQQMELGPAIKSDQPMEENSDSQSETESSASSPDANTPSKEKNLEIAAVVSASPEKVSDDGYDSATPLKPSDLMKKQSAPPRPASNLSNDEAGSNDNSKASGVSDTEQDITVSEKCAQAISQNESSMSLFVLALEAFRVAYGHQWRDIDVDRAESEKIESHIFDKLARIAANKTAVPSQHLISVIMLDVLLASLFHPSELNALITYKFLRPESNLQRNQKLIANNERKKQCYKFLDLTSRSFSAVIQELDDELRDAVCLFYLVLRGLDTIEDDMTLDLDRKCELLRSFDKIIYQRGWNFTESGPNEKDRHLLVGFNVVIDEFLALPKKYQDVIADITKQMGNGMADYASGDHRENTAVATIKDFDLYCHYVAGLVGWGLSDLFAASGLEDPIVAKDKKLSDSMGMFLQKTNIIRDYREDLDDGRQFWPKQIWGKYTDDFAGLIKPENADTAQTVLSAMVLNVLEHIPEVLTYLSQLKNQSVFNFCAIPQVMAISTLALVFNNKDVYQKNVKIRKGEAIKLIMASTDLHNVVAIFREYIHVLSKKNDARDPNFMNISIAIGKVCIANG
ncbi:hypothetical protein INT43_007017, partial [Umbelopsis isabellina]